MAAHSGTTLISHSNPMEGADLTGVLLQNLHADIDELLGWITVAELEEAVQFAIHEHLESQVVSPEYRAKLDEWERQDVEYVKQARMLGWLD